MCNWLSLEICCCQPTHPFPYTLKLCRCMVLCRPIARDFKISVAMNGKVVRSVEDFGSRCRNYDKEYLRCERIFYSTCEDCTRRISPTVPDYDEVVDLPIYLSFQQLLREELAKAVQNKLYQDLVRVLASEFKITERFMLKGSRWVKAPTPTKEDPLGPNPSYDSKLNGLKWWLQQGFGGQVHNKLWKDFCGNNYPADPFGRSIQDWVVPLSSYTRNPPSAGTGSVSTFTSPAPYEGKRSFSPNERFGGYNSWQEFQESYDWYPKSTDEEDSDEK
ncbi:hypothetical protein M434DRAFT_36132 [Hypoxylon sp. CO27-5]|nr:hypothetical protein M434DRAFT_36132 [Hypoxylon sp. CO27-5]